MVWENHSTNGLVQLSTVKKQQALEKRESWFPELQCYSIQMSGFQQNNSQNIKKQESMAHLRETKW